MDRLLRNTFLGLRHWSGRVTDFPDDALLCEPCGKVAAGMEVLLQEDVWEEGKVFWRALCMERYKGRANFFLHIAEKDLRRRAEDFYTIVAGVADGFVDHELREQVVSICRCLVSVCDCSLEAPHAPEPEPLFSTHLGRPILTLVSNGAPL